MKAYRIGSKTSVGLVLSDFHEIWVMEGLDGWWGIEF